MELHLDALSVSGKRGEGDVKLLGDLALTAASSSSFKTSRSRVESVSYGSITHLEGHHSQRLPNVVSK